MEGSSSTCLQTNTCTHTHAQLYRHPYDNIYFCCFTASLIRQSVWQGLPGNRLRKHGTWHVERESNQALRHSSAKLCRLHWQTCTYHAENKKAQRRHVYADLLKPPRNIKRIPELSCFIFSRPPPFFFSLSLVGLMGDLSQNRLDKRAASRYKCVFEYEAFIRRASESSWLDYICKPSQK